MVDLFQFISDQFYTSALIHWVNATFILARLMCVELVDWMLGGVFDFLLFVAVVVTEVIQVYLTVT